jgi:hypothetical protein
MSNEGEPDDPKAPPVETGGKVVSLKDAREIAEALRTAREAAGSLANTDGPIFSEEMLRELQGEPTDSDYVVISPEAVDALRDIDYVLALSILNSLSGEAVNVDLETYRAMADRYEGFELSQRLAEYKKHPERFLPGEVYALAEKAARDFNPALRGREAPRAKEAEPEAELSQEQVDEFVPGGFATILDSIPLDLKAQLQRVEQRSPYFIYGIKLKSDGTWVAYLGSNSVQSDTARSFNPNDTNDSLVQIPLKYLAPVANVTPLFGPKGTNSSE